MYQERTPTLHHKKGSVIQTRKEPELIPQKRELLDNSFEMNITKLSRNQIILKMVIPDLTEILLVLTSLLLNFIFMRPILDMNLFEPFMVVYWGIFSLGLTAWRWGYSSIIHFMSRQATFEKKLAKGEYVVDFNISGMAFSALLIIFGVLTSGIV